MKYLRSKTLGCTAQIKGLENKCLWHRLNFKHSAALVIVNIGGTVQTRTAKVSPALGYSNVHRLWQVFYSIVVVVYLFLEKDTSLKVDPEYSI